MKTIVSTIMILLILAVMVEISHADNITALEGLTGKVGNEDISWGTGEATDTFSVPTYSGTTVTLTKIPHLDALSASFIKGKWYIAEITGNHADPALVGSLAWVITNKSGGVPVSIGVAGPYTYTITSNMTIPANVHITLDAGAVLSISSGKVITLDPGATIDGDTNKVMFSGSGSVVGLATATPQMFGAMGDEATDDSVAFTKSFASLKNGGMLKLLPATYMVKDVVMDITTNRIGLSGETGATLKVISGSSWGLKIHDSVSGCNSATDLSIIKGVKIDGNDLSVYPLWIDHATQTIIEDTSIYNSAYPAIYLDNPCRCFIKNNRFYDTNGVLTSSAATIIDVTYEDNMSYRQRASSTTIYLETTDGFFSHNNLFFGSSAGGNDYAAKHVYIHTAAVQVSFIGDKFWNTHGNKSTTTYAHAIYLMNTAEVRIIGCDFQTIGSEFYGYAIVVNNIGAGELYRGLVISGNTFNRPTAGAILLTSGIYDAVISGNTFFNCNYVWDVLKQPYGSAYSCIELVAPQSHVSITGNSFIETRIAGGRALSAISIGAGVTNSLIGMNYINKNVTDGEYWVTAPIIDGSGAGNYNTVVSTTGSNVGIGTVEVGTGAEEVLVIGTGVPPSTSPEDVTQLYSKNAGGVAGKATLHKKSEASGGTLSEVVPGIYTKTTTGDLPAENSYEGMMVTNTFDNKFQTYAEGAWRTLATW